MTFALTRLEVGDDLLDVGVGQRRAAAGHVLLDRRAAQVEPAAVEPAGARRGRATVRRPTRSLLRRPRPRRRAAPGPSRRTAAGARAPTASGRPRPGRGTARARSRRARPCAARTVAASPAPPPGGRRRTRDAAGAPGSPARLVSQPSTSDRSRGRCRGSRPRLQQRRCRAAPTRPRGTSRTRRVIPPQFHQPSRKPARAAVVDADDERVLAPGLAGPSAGSVNGVYGSSLRPIAPAVEEDLGAAADAARSAGPSRSPAAVARAAGSAAGTRRSVPWNDRGGRVRPSMTCGTVTRFHGPSARRANSQPSASVDAAADGAPAPGSPSTPSGEREQARRLQADARRATFMTRRTVRLRRASRAGRRGARIPRARAAAAPPRPVGRRGRAGARPGRGRAWRSRGRRRSSSAPSRSAAPIRGRRRTDAAIASSSVPCSRRRSFAVFSPIPFAPGSPSLGSPRSAMKSGHLLGIDAVALADLVGPDQLRARPCRRAGTGPARSSETHWNMSRSPVKSSAVPPASVSVVRDEPSRSSASSVSWLSTRPAERAEEVVARRPTGARARRAPRAGRRGRAGRAPCGTPPPRRRSTGRPRAGRGCSIAHSDEVHRAQQRVDRLVVVVGDRLGQREERPVEQRRARRRRAGDRRSCPQDGTSHRRWAVVSDRSRLVAIVPTAGP